MAHQRTPALTALQLFFDAALPADRGAAFTVEVGGRPLGDFRLDWLRAEGSGAHGEHVLLRLRPAK